MSEYDNNDLQDLEEVEGGLQQEASTVGSGLKDTLNSHRESLRNHFRKEDNNKNTENNSANKNDAENKNDSKQSQDVRDSDDSLMRKNNQSPEINSNQNSKKKNSNNDLKNKKKSANSSKANKGSKASKSGAKSSKKAKKKSNKSEDSAKALKKLYSYVSGLIGASATAALCIILICIMLIVIIMCVVGAAADSGSGSGSSGFGKATNNDYVAMCQKEIGNGGSKYWTACGSVPSDWCGWFVYWSLKEYGVEPSDYGASGVVGDWVSFAEKTNNHTKYHKRGDGYDPKAGDFFIQHNASPSSHIGVVESCDSSNKTFTSVEGNHNGSYYGNSSVCSATRSYADDSNYVQGFIETDLSTGTSSGKTSSGGSSKSGGSSGNYSPRLEAPSTSNKCYYSDNVFYQSGYGLPNCTAYAWGRAYELLGKKPNLCTGNAGNWYEWNKSNNAYSYGRTPKLGAILCLGKVGGAGHVAVVEQISSDGTIVTSESAYGGVIFQKLTRSKGNYELYYPYYFQGFIYILENGASVSSESALASSSSSTSSGEGIKSDNGTLFFDFTFSKYNGGSVGDSGLGGSGICKDSYTPDTNYTGQKYSLTKEERAFLECVVTGEFGSDEVGTVLIAQCLRDALVNGELNDPMKAMHTSSNGGMGYTGYYSPASEAAKNAIKYVFDEGKYGAQHRLYYMCTEDFYNTGYSAWHYSASHGSSPTIKFVLQHENVLFFDKL